MAFASSFDGIEANTKEIIKALEEKLTFWQTIPEKLKNMRKSFVAALTKVFSSEEDISPGQTKLLDSPNGREALLAFISCNLDKPTQLAKVTSYISENREELLKLAFDVLPLTEVKNPNKHFAEVITKIIFAEHPDLETYWWQDTAGEDLDSLRETREIIDPRDFSPLSLHLDIAAKDPKKYSWFKEGYEDNLRAIPFDQLKESYLYIIDDLINKKNISALSSFGYIADRQVEEQF